MARAGDAGTARARRRAAGPSRATDAARAALRRRLAPGLAAAGFDLEDVTVSRAGSRQVVRVVVDRDGGIDLDQVADASRLVSAILDEAENTAGRGAGSSDTSSGDAGSGEAGPGEAGDTEVGDFGLTGPYVLEVTSPGVDRPLTEPRHWRRAVGRLVLVRRQDGTTVEGRVLSADEEGADLAVPTGPPRRGRPVRRRIQRVVYGEVARATVQVEFGSAADDEALLEENPADENRAGPAEPEQLTGQTNSTDPTGSSGKEMNR